MTFIKLICTNLPLSELRASNPLSELLWVAYVKVQYRVIV